MKRQFVLLCACVLIPVAISNPANASPLNSVTVRVPRVDVAAPGSSQTDPNLIVWQTYDDFSGPNLDLALWEPMTGRLTTGVGGLTLFPPSLPGPGHSSAGLRATFPINIGGYFALRVPFTVQAATVDLPGNVDFNIDICGPHQTVQCDSLGWGMTNNQIPPHGSTPISGNFFVFDIGTEFLIQPTTVATGQLAMIYSGGEITSFIDEGSGWQLLGHPFSPPSEWIPLRFELDADVDVVTPTQTPEPNSGVLLCLAITVLAMRRKVIRDR